MKVSLNWLKEYVDIDITPEELSDKMTRSGNAVEYITRSGEGIEGVVTGRVKEIVHHKEADKLWVCQVDIGKEELVQIVTGADNVKQNSVVPVVQVGGELPGKGKMKKAKLRGVESYGMLCSAAELCIEDKLLQPHERTGIFLLPEDTPIGKDIKEILGLDDVVLDVELTANRGDCMSMIGIAREVAAITGKTVKYPDISVKEEGAAPEKDINIIIEDSDLCYRFAARMCTDIKIGQSPLWMQTRLRAAGMRPINNVVDVSNYVMLELGQPTHAYDSEKLSGDAIITRKSVPGEKLVTLDDIERTLTEGMIVIADKDKGIGLGGVMGGLETEISDTTKYVIMEAACFDPVSIRKTSRALGLASEASSRFTHGIDRGNILTALDRIAHLLEHTGVAKIVAGHKDNYPAPKERAVIKTSVGAINSRLGTNIKAEAMISIMENLGFYLEKDFNTAHTDIEFVITVPSWRNDVTGDADISEELARITGYDSIESSMPGGILMQGMQNSQANLLSVVKDTLCANGLSEVLCYSFINDTLLRKLELPESDSRYKAISLSNPITDEFTIMRTTLLPSVLSACEYNIAHRNEDIAVFETGNIYIADKLPLEKLALEQLWLCIALTGKRADLSWNGGKEKIDFYDIKGLAEEIFDKINISSYSFVRGAGNYMHPGKSARIVYNGTTIGQMGALHPKIADNFNLGDTYVLELCLADLADDALKVNKYEKLPRYPEIYRDMAMLVKSETAYDDIVAAIKKSGGEYLKEVKIFDLYEGKQIKEGYKSMAYALSFQSAERTLTDEEVTAAVDDIVKTLKGELDIELR